MQSKTPLLLSIYFAVELRLPTQLRGLNSKGISISGKGQSKNEQRCNYANCITKEILILVAGLDRCFNKLLPERERG